MKVGTLVKEKEGHRFGGVVVEVMPIDEPYRGHESVRVQWADGVNTVYKKTFVEEIPLYPNY
jgi:hypothetical protein|tara:strand:- start:33 stop:218 length:186 start_codon:yes stop_codon:yes gene_type:complete